MLYLYGPGEELWWIDRGAIFLGLVRGQVVGGYDFVFVDVLSAACDYEAQWLDLWCGAFVRGVWEVVGDGVESD